MRVLHINSYYSVGPFYKGLYDAQAALGEHIEVFVPVARGFDGAERDCGAYATISPDHAKHDRLVFHLKHAKIGRDARARYAGGAFDVLHAHSLFSNGYIAWKLHRELGIPYIAAVRDTDINTFFRRMPHLRNLGRAILRDASRLVFLSKPYRDDALRPYLSEAALRDVHAKSAVIPNGIDPFWHEHRAPAPHAMGPERIRLLLVGRASKRKNVEAALDAAQMLIDRGIGVAFDVVIGLVEDEAILSRIGQRPFVTLHRNLTREQLLPLYRKNDLFLLPSLQETFGLVYAEAMSQALPVIYTRGQGFDGQFEDGHVGFSVNPHDPAQIAQRILDVRRDYGRIAQNALDESARYDWDRFAREYDAIYREVSGLEG